MSPTRIHAPRWLSRPMWRWPAVRRTLRHHVRHATWPAVLGAVLAGTVALFTFALCVEDPRTELRTRTGIQPCTAAVVRFVPTPYNDLLRFEVSADPRVCAPALQVSILMAARGACDDFLARTGGCFYLARRQVMVQRLPPPPDGSARYTIDAY